MIFDGHRREEKTSWLGDVHSQDFCNINFEVNAEKTQSITDNQRGFKMYVNIEGKKLASVRSFIYLGPNFWHEGTRSEPLARIMQSTAALARLKSIWKDKGLVLGIKVRQMRSLIMVTCLFVYKSLTLWAELESRILTVGFRFNRRILCITYNDSITNTEIRRRIKIAIGTDHDMLTFTNWSVTSLYIIKEEGHIK